MYESLIGENVSVIVSSRGEKVLEYIGVLSSESEDTIVLSNVDVFYLTKVSYAYGSREEVQKFKSNMRKAIINKKYIISCDK